MEFVNENCKVYSEIETVELIRGILKTENTNHLNYEEMVAVLLRPELYMFPVLFEKFKEDISFAFSLLGPVHERFKTPLDELMPTMIGPVFFKYFDKAVFDRESKKIEEK